MTSPNDMYKSGAVWLVTERTAPAWQAALDLLVDGPKPIEEVAAVMREASALHPQTIDKHLKSASRRGWISNRRGTVTLRREDLIRADLGAVQ